MSQADSDKFDKDENQVQTRVDAAHPAASADSVSDSQPRKMEESQKLARVASVTAQWQEEASSDNASDSTSENTSEDQTGDVLRLLPPEEFQADQVEQLRRHAVQLAEHLQQRQLELDHREAQINARAASVESQARTTRLWLEEQRTALGVRRQMADEAGQPQSAEYGENKTKEAGQDGNSQKAFEDLTVEDLVTTGNSRNLTQEEAEILEEGAIGTEDEGSASHDSTDDNENGEQMQFEQRQRELDKRQAQLYQDIEDLTVKRAEVRGQQEELDAIRKELESTRGELIKRRQELEKQASENGEKSEQLESLRHELDSSVEEQEIQCEETEQRERQLDSRLREIETALIRFERLGVTEQRMRSLEQEVAEADARCRYLGQAESLLAEQQNDLADTKRELEQERLAFDEECYRERQVTTEQRSRDQAEINTRRRALDQRATEIDNREATIEHVRLELAASQREVLELRLATEEVWAQLSGALAPATLSRSIAQTRARLSDQYRQEASDLSARKELLEGTSRRLAEHSKQLAEQQDEIHRWAQRRQEEIELQAQRLVQRERELDRQQVSFDDLHARWEQERNGYQEQIRELLSSARLGNPSAVDSRAAA